MSYTKLFGSILDSTVWQSPAHVRIVWITMLAMKDRDGRVEASIPGLARRAIVTIEQCEEALALFMSPDKYSRTKDHDGRRIREIDGGWEVLNHDKYRELLDADDVREKNAERQRRKRERDSHASSRDVTPDHAISRHADPDADPGSEITPGFDPALPEPLDLGAIVRAEREAAPGRDVTAIPEPPAPPPPGTHQRHLMPHQVPHPDRARDAARSRLCTEAWQYALAQHNTLRMTEGIDPHAQSWEAAPGASYPPFVELRARVAELVRSEADLEAARARIRHRVNVAAAAARRDATLRWFTPSVMWDPKHFARDVELSVEQALSPRHGPRGSGPAPFRPDPERRPSKRLG